MGGVPEHRKLFKESTPHNSMKKRNFHLKEHRKWRELLLERDGGCAVCNETEKVLASHHILPECLKYKKYATELMNGIILCPTHHIWGIMSAHKHPLWFVDWLKKNRPDQYNWAMERIDGI